MNKNVLIVNYNTQKITEACIKSINRCVKNCQIYVFDNSDKTPFINTFKNVYVIDNTKKQIINFDHIIEKHKNYYNKGAMDNNFGSFKHCISVEYAMDIINDNFVLLDSDVLVKKDFSFLYDETKIYVGRPEKIHRLKKRVEPFMLFINTKMCKKNNIHFYDENHMFGFYKTNGENYDTGCWFYEACLKLPKKEVDLAPYREHFRAASWYKDAVEKQKYKKSAPDGWLLKNKSLWYVKENEEMKKLNEIFKHIYCMNYLLNGKNKQKTKDELKRVGIDNSAVYFSYEDYFENPLNSLIFETDKLKVSNYFKQADKEKEKNWILKFYDIVKDAYNKKYDNILVFNDDTLFQKDEEYLSKMFNSLPDNADIILFDKVVSTKQGEIEKYKKYISSLQIKTPYINKGDVLFEGSSCFSLNRKAMKKILNLFKKEICPFNEMIEKLNLSVMFPITNLAVSPNMDKIYKEMGVDIVNVKKKEAEKQATPKRITMAIPKKQIKPNVNIVKKRIIAARGGRRINRLYMI